MGDNERHVTDIGKDAVRRFDEGLHCAESVLAAVAANLGIESPLIPRIATGLCGGMSRTCGPCGALTGGILCLNLALGRNGPEEPVERNYSAVQEFIRLFRQRHGSVNCAELLGCDLGTEEGRHVFQMENLRIRCREFTATAAELAIDIIGTRGGCS